MRLIYLNDDKGRCKRYTKVKPPSNLSMSMRLITSHKQELKALVSTALVIGWMLPWVSLAGRIEPMLEQPSEQSEELFNLSDDLNSYNPCQEKDNTDLSDEEFDKLYQDCLTTVEDITEPQSDGFLNMQFAPGNAVLKGSVEVDKTIEPEIEVLYDDQHTIEAGEKISLVMLDFIATGYSQHGDPFHALVHEDIMRDEQTLIPKGTLVSGEVQYTKLPGSNLKKRGEVALLFKDLLMPDGRKVPLNSEVKKGDNAIKAVGRAIGGGIGGTIIGAIKGIFKSIAIGGIGTALATNGLTTMVGGGLGALSGLEKGISKSGDHVLFDRGDVVNVALHEPLKLPVVKMPSETELEVHLAGLKVDITNLTLGMDPFGNANQLTIQMDVTNFTDNHFGTYDIGLMDADGNTFNTSPFGNTGSLYNKIQAQSEGTNQLTFTVNNPQNHHFLVFYKPYSREVIAKYSLSEAYKMLTQQKPKKDKA